MRKIDREAALAFLNGSKKFKRGNTKVEFGPGASFLYLYGHAIAVRSRSTRGSTVVFLHSCGERTRTTKNRLNAILEVIGEGIIFSRNHEWRRQTKGLESKPWEDGEVFVRIPTTLGNERLY